MKIASGIARSGRGFELDTGAIGMYSISHKEIKLPYSGTLPEHMGPVKTAYIYLNVQLIQGARLVLSVDDGSGRPKSRPLDASSAEIIALLDRFFSQSEKLTGMEDYWRGVCHGHYIEWRKFVTAPDLLLDAIATLSDQDKRFLHKHIMDQAAAV